mgnify:CR=1 FL=1
MFRLNDRVKHTKRGDVAGTVTKVCPKKFELDREGGCKWPPSNFVRETADQKRQSKKKTNPKKIQSKKENFIDYIQDSYSDLGEKTANEVGSSQLRKLTLSSLEKLSNAFQAISTKFELYDHLDSENANLVKGKLKKSYIEDIMEACPLLALQAVELSKLKRESLGKLLNFFLRHPQKSGGDLYTDPVFRKLKHYFDEEKNDFVHFPQGEDQILSVAERPDSIQDYKWEDLKCTVQFKIGRFTLKTNCPSKKKLGAQKVFIKGYRDLYDYAISIKQGHITEEDHIQLFSYLRGQPGKLVNHNLDVGILHFKYE